MNRRVFGVCLFGAALGANACASRESPATSTLRILDLADPAGPGAVAIGWLDGAVAHLEYGGMAEVEQGTPLRPDSVIRIASLTKQFTAVAILALVDSGALSLDDSLGARLPACPERWREISLRQLLSHTSGLTPDMGPVFAKLTDEFRPEELIGAFAAVPLSSVPGSAWAYSNLNYWILGRVIEWAARTPYRDFVGDRVLAPAQLALTRYGDFSAIIPGRARGYVYGARDRLENAPAFSSTIGYAAGGYVSTPIEMARWYDVLGRGRIVPRGLLKEALTPQQLTSGERVPFGLGWRLEKQDGRLVAFHGGSTIGFGAFALWRPDDGAFAAVFSNKGGEEPETAARAAFSLVTTKAARQHLAISAE